MLKKKFELGPNQKRWIKRLKMTRHKQGTGSLNESGKFCCLGIACEEFKDDLNIVVGKLNWDNETTYYNNEDEVLPFAVLNFVKLHNNTGDPHFKEDDHFDQMDAEEKNLYSLIALNDEHGFTFTQIAKHLEKYPQYYFYESA